MKLNAAMRRTVLVASLSGVSLVGLMVESKGKVVALGSLSLLER